MRIGYRDYKLKVKSQQIPVPVIPDDWKKCSECMEFKPVDQFYLSHAKNPVKMCKVCYKEYYEKKKKTQSELKGGLDTYFKFPNEYTSEIQRKQVFMVMEVCGWIFDKSTGIWNKPGLKENGVFINITPTPKKYKKPSYGGGRKIKSGVWNNVERIVKMLEEGYTYNDVAETFDCSHTTIRSIITNYRNEKKP
jgi:uncharacterized protein (DUF433 family)